MKRGKKYTAKKAAKKSRGKAALKARFRTKNASGKKRGPSIEPTKPWPKPGTGGAA